MKNPFTIKGLPHDVPFWNREKEQRELLDYAQKLAYPFDRPPTKISVKDVEGGFRSMIQSEATVFEAILPGLAPQQIALVMAVAKEPLTSIPSANAMNRHTLRSVGGVQAALKKRMQKDFIEKRDKKSGRWSTLFQAKGFPKAVRVEGKPPGPCRRGLRRGG
ncbi:hypothetical protein JCM14469_01040 [Desulfatiferula olefinivorans]